MTFDGIIIKITEIHKKVDKNPHNFQRERGPGTTHLQIQKFLRLEITCELLR